MNGMVGSRFILAVRRWTRDVRVRGDWRRKNGIVDDGCGSDCRVWKVYVGVIKYFDENDTTLGLGFPTPHKLSHTI